MKQKDYYKVGEHIFSLAINTIDKGELQLSPYEPFKIESTTETLFDVEIVDQLCDTILEPVIVDAPLSSSRMPQVNIYRVEAGFRYDIIMPDSNVINASAIVDYNHRSAKVALAGDIISKSSAFNNALILSYTSFTMEYSTLLLHASTVIHEGKAYLFLGKSGTGKSTHSRMWLKAFKDSELLNDDHPIVRYWPDGTVTTYGSPWSGKTPCYRNLSAPLGAIVRISRASNNSLERLRPLKAFASTTTSCSGVQWSKKLYEDKVKAIENIVTSSRSYIMHCLPNTNAAEVCFNGIKADK